MRRRARNMRKLHAEAQRPFDPENYSSPFLAGNVRLADFGKLAERSYYGSGIAGPNQLRFLLYDVLVICVKQRLRDEHWRYCVLGLYQGNRLFLVQIIFKV